MNRAEILAMFAKRAQGMIDKWPADKGDNPLEVPQANGYALVEIVKGLNSRKKITSVLDMGCGLGRWVPFWVDGIGVGRYTGVEPVQELMVEAERRHEAANNIEIILGDLVDLDPALGKRHWDLGFTFTVLEHIPPGDVAKAAQVLKERTKRLCLIEMVKASKGAGFCEYVFEHNYEELFGPWSFSQMLDANKAIMLWDQT